MQEIVDQIDIKATLGNIPVESGLERNKAITTEIQNVEKSNEIVKQWAIAAKMRRWLVQKKQNIAERVSK